MLTLLDMALVPAMSGQLVCLKATLRATARLLQPFIRGVIGGKGIVFQGLAKLKTDVVDEPALADEDGGQDGDMPSVG